MAGATWIDLLDPSEAEIRKHTPASLDHASLQQLLRAADAEGGTRPTLLGEQDHVFGVLLVAVALPEEDRVFYQEVDLVITRETLLTVRKTPPGEEPFDPAPVRAICDVKGHLPPGAIVYHLVDDIAERYLDLLDAVDDEIDELEEHVEEWPNEQLRRRMSELRHDLLHIRRTLAPTRDAVRAIVDGRVDVASSPLRRREIFPDQLERAFAGVYDKLLRATDALELSRDLLAAARDYHQAKVANDQNEVMKRLTVIASLLLFPTLIVGVYGQNFDHIPELHWYLGYAWSWAIIVVSTIVQLVFFRWKRWI